MFDVYGTIAHINDKRSPFAGLLGLGQLRGRPKTDEDARTLMGRSLGLRDAAAVLRINLEAEELEKLEHDPRSRSLDTARAVFPRAIARSCGMNPVSRVEQIARPITTNPKMSTHNDFPACHA
ncbi:hypothetical protein [Pseudoduganella lutea]|uniref:Uncharacterized protein n=1 Tax=Pseudoduganella lutea TaxID=321985 RepID=A0A4P6KTY8_9BURK|nr:hypothetical protein [Pseudoduganella lutea]QBE62065.1 hypothetical protein EWM63_02925 [Pseudoduganella lutea]